jgi:RHS repeat-associated protein
MSVSPWVGALTGGMTAVFDAWNRLVEAKLSTFTLTRNEYDGLGRRIVRVDGLADPDVTYDYYYNERWQVITEVKDGSAYAIYHWHPFYEDALAARMRAGDTHFFLHDANFNVTAAIEDSTNNVVERYAYTPYGEVTVLNADFTLDNDGTDIGNTHFYTGRERDPETGLQLNRNRFYAGYLGRWLQRDPIGYFGSPYNLYEYVHSSPLNSVDPSGMVFHCAPWPEELADGRAVKESDGVWTYPNSRPRGYTLYCFGITFFTKTDDGKWIHRCPYTFGNNEFTSRDYLVQTCVTDADGPGSEPAYKGTNEKICYVYMVRDRRGNDGRQYRKGQLIIVLYDAQGTVLGRMLMDAPGDRERVPTPGQVQGEQLPPLDPPR